jgi:hypothetical protein
MANDRPPRTHWNASPEPAELADPAITSGLLWRELAEALRRAERLIVDPGVAAGPDAELLRAEGHRYLTRLLAGGIRLCVELADADHPELGRMVDTTISWGIDNPDCIYLYASVRGDATYRVFGNRGTAHHFDVQVNRGHFAEAPAFGVVSSCNGRELATSADGDFELVLAPDRHDGNWLKLEEDAEWLLIRQYFYDWEHERPAELSIERAGADSPPPSLTSDRMAARLRRLVRWLDVGASYWDQMARYSYERGPNTMFFRGLDETAWGGLRGLAYGFGNFACGRDEAVLLEVEPPCCHYWSFSLANRYWETLDWVRRQASLNGHQTVLDDDGVFRAVIAHEDPGVANWLDPAGNPSGTMMGRYLLTDSAPVPSLRVLPAAELRRRLPASMPRVTAAERAELLARRRLAAWRRNRQ